ncbi:YadA-like family protein [Sphingomonas sp. IC-11]|uniref:YadA family autotransporter adhesin n=1 Tax=Sphingomonas sp. IC-11 TaxID=2898528 RepID=UPI001E56AD18|nr:YadA-like family protein [Sphingomonas sp. IC-11]MCD2314553.1 YadA-like family protein [Sphingomonas sp. IC-11]
MADIEHSRSTFAARLLSRTVLSSPILLAVLSAQQAQAQQRVVSACSGVSLPRSAVTDILTPVITGIASPVETTVNGILDIPLLGALLPDLSLNATGLLTQAASGAPITLQVLATDGTVVAPSDQCRLTSDSITLDTPAGVAIGGNQITGLGADGAAAFASDINAIAFGNNARTEAGALGSVALGTNSSVTAANSVALGAGSIAGRGALANYTATGLTGAQNSAGEVSIGAPGAERQLTNVAPGTAPTDAATVGQVDGVASQVAALGATAVQYDGAARDRVTLAGTDGTVLANVAPGAVTAASTEAVNGSQLFATNAQVAANTAAIAGLGNGSAGAVRYSNPDNPTVPNGGTVTDDATLAGASGGPVGLHNVRGGTLAAGSTDAVNGDQLFATNQAVAANTGAITDLDGRVTTNEANIANLTTGVANNTAAITDLQNTVAGTNTNVTNLTNQVNANTNDIATINNSLANQPLRYADAATPTTPNGGTVTDDATLAGASGGPVGLRNVRAGALVAGSTDAVNGDQLATTNAQVAANTTAITNFSNLVTGSAVSPVQYSNPDNPTAPNGGTLTNDVTLVGANPAAPVALHNIAGGAVSATSTDAVNGQQLYAVSTQAANSIQYDRDAAGARTNSVTLAGADPAAAVALNNVAAGTVAAGSTQAVNGGQLYATNQVAQQAATLGANSVQYDQGRTSVTFNTTGSAVVLRNVAAGTSATDAVNVGQLQSGLQGAVNQANSYTDTRLSQALSSMNFNLREVRRDLSAGTSSALAAAGLPQANEPGRSMVAVGGGTYRGQTALAIGASTFLNDGHSIFRIGASIDSQGYGGANAGFGYQF